MSDFVGFADAHMYNLISIYSKYIFKKSALLFAEISVTVPAATAVLKGFQSKYWKEW